MTSMPSTDSLRSRVYNAGVWVLGGHFASQVLRLASNLIMTRLLVPEMFGIMAIANVLVLGLALFSDFGLRLNIIQSKRGADPVFLNTVWVIQIFRGGIIWLLALGIATVLFLLSKNQLLPATSVYADPILPYVIGVISLNAVINGFDSTKIGSANRNISLGLITRLELISQVVGLCVMITWAMIDRSIWALIAGSLTNSIVRMALSHLTLPGDSNRFKFDSKAFWEIFRFGKWVFLSSLLSFLLINGDRLLLGGFIDSKTLGFYAIALLLLDALHLVFDKVVSTVVVPALSEVVRNKPGELKQVYYKFRMPIDITLFFAMGFLFMSGHLIVDVLYDDRYREAGYMLEILCLSLFAARFNVTDGVFLALGKPKLLIPATIIELCVLASLIPIMSLGYGMDTALWVIACVSLSGLPIIFYFKKKFGVLDIYRELQWLPVILVGCLAGISMEKLFSMLGWT